MDYTDRKNRFYIDSYGSLRNTIASIIQKDENDSLVINANNAYIENDSIFLNQYIFRTDSILGRRMFDYWPLVVQMVVNFQAIIASEYPEFEMGWMAKDEALDNAFLTTMGESRVEEWEKILQLPHEDGDTIEMRRDAVIARIRGQGKLNTESINRIVNVFTGGTATSYIQDSTLYVLIIPPKENREYRFSSIEAELERRKPAHLGLVARRPYQTWGDVKRTCATWQVESETYDTWNDTMYNISN